MWEYLTESEIELYERGFGLVQKNQGPGSMKGDLVAELRSNRSGCSSFEGRYLTPIPRSLSLTRGL